MALFVGVLLFIYYLIITHQADVSFPFFFFFNFNLEQNDMFEFFLFRTGR